MASSDDAVEQSLSSSTATPIAQLNPDLPDQATRKVKGEITITWPYSFVTKTFAFLLAEPDFRLRRNKGQVRIQLKGPSAEAVGKWELGSGDEVTLALDGVEWAKDEEPARPAGSRSEWQLKFAGKLMLKATLGETQETKFVHIDQPVPIIVPEAPSPIPFAEIDLTIFDAPLAAEDPPTLPAPNNDDEYASPMFMKRSRAYDPLFELDLDDELEDDGGRKGKGRKRPRYSALNGRWRFNEDNSSPEPDQTEGTPSAAPGQKEDVDMHDTPERSSMADGGVQTNEFDLAPVPSSLVNTPSKPWSGADNSIFSEESRPHDVSRIDWGIQASPSRQAISAPTGFHEEATAHTTPNSFGQVTQSSGFAAFGLPQEHLQNQGFGNASSAFGGIPAASSNQGFGGTSSPFGAGSHGPSSQGFGDNTSPFGTAANPPANQGLGQTPSLFGMNPAQAQSASSQVPDVGSGFGATSGSVRFSFGQEPSSAFATSSLGTTQAPGHFAADPYPESSLGQQDLSNYPLSTSQEPVGTATEGSPYGGIEAPMEQTQPEAHTPEQGVPLWPMGSSNFDSSHAIDRVNTSEDVRSDGSDPKRSPPGMIPPAVDDGTRNLDEMKQEGILSQPVYRQGVSREALPGQEHASAGEEDESMDSDEQAAYDDSEKGDDYDLRNYDRVSDDEEGFEEEEPLSDDELLDEGPEHWAGAEGYEEDDYDDEEEDIDDFNVDVQAPGRFTQPQLPSQPPAQKDKVVIDLLSDSDDEESPVPPIKAPRSQIPPPESQRHSKSESLSKSESVDFSETESMDQHDHRVAPSGPSLPSDGSVHGISGDRQEGANLDQAEELEDEGGRHTDEEHLHEHGDDSEPNSEFAESDDEEEAEEVQEAITVNPAAEPNLPSTSLNGAMDWDDGQQEAGADEEDEEPKSKVELNIVDGPIGTDPQPDSDERETVMATDDEKADYHAASFQTQPDEMIASFQFRVPGSPSVDHSPEGNATSDAVMEDVDDQEENQVVGDDEPRQDTSELDRGEIPEREGIDLEPKDNAERSDVKSDTEVVEVVAEEVTTVEAREDPEVRVSLDQQDEPSASSTLQDQAGATSAMSVLETSETTVFSHAETQSSNQEVMLEKQQVELKTRTVLSQPVEETEGTDGESDHLSSAEENDVEMVDAEVAVGSELDTEQAGIPQTLPTQDIKQDEAVQCLTPSDMVQEPQEEVTDPVSALSVTAGVIPEQEAHEKQRIFTHSEMPHVDDGNDDDDDEEFHDASEMVEQPRTSPIAALEDSFASVDSQVSEIQDAEEPETVPEEKSKRGGKKARNTSSSKSAKSTPASQKAQRQSSRQSSRQVSAQQAPSSQRTTRSKTMSFQAASPKEDKEDMSIQLARAALKSPTSKKRKVSATTAKRVNSDLVKRLEHDLPDCVALKDLRKYNANFVDIAAVATSANIPPKRTPTREYASSFTIADPSVTPDGVVEVELYSLHKDHLPVVKTGDSVLLRSFVVVSLPGRGFGLKTKDGSSWAVFKSEGDDEPEMNAAPVEMSDKEAKFMLDVRAWYAGLDDTAKGKLGEAVEGAVAAGKESRANLKK
ncbi:hypothetical protein N0V82_009768 [Gnomoniopsis sp. IMI 355080]|nr:hypothetical protein N0V82_009768 [Gnomoniopsis sp. IMI 355080]